MVASTDSAGARARPYHVGHVRESLLTHAGELLRSGGLPTLNLRALSARSDVALGSVYHHFASKDDLLAALATQGFVDLRQSMLDAVAGSSKQVLRKSVMAYFDFARREPEIYALMFEARVARADPVRCARAAAYRVFQEVIAAGRIAQGRAGETTPATLTAIWACIHGASLLSMADEDGDELIETTIHGLEDMLRANR